MAEKGSVDSFNILYVVKLGVKSTQSKWSSRQKWV